MWKWACLVPHPPIIIPEVGRGNEKEAVRTIQGMSDLTQRLEKEKRIFSFTFPCSLH